MHIEPEMKHLHQLVIPKVYEHWKEVVVCLGYSQQTLDDIQKSKNHRNVFENLLRDWLCTDDSEHPHNWETLINSLMEVDQLITPAKQIKKEVEELIR